MLVFTGCVIGGLEPVDIGGRGGEIVFNLGFADDPATRVVTDVDHKCSWEVGDAVGIFVMENGVQIAASGNYSDNVKLTYDGDDKWTASEPILWSEEGGLDFFAYYPYDPSFDPTTSNLTVPADQSGGYATLDRMSAQNNGDGAGLTDGDDVTLYFEHVFAMVQLTVDASMIPTDPADPPVVTLRGVTLGDATTDITMHRTETEPGVYVCRALVPPQQTIAEGTVMFTFPVHYTHPENKVRNFGSEPLTEPLNLEAGAAEAFTLTFKLDDYTPLIPDTGGYSNIIDLVDGWYGNGDGVVSYEEMMEVTELSVWMEDISSLEGIQYLKNLATLECSVNYITELNVASLTKLETLLCDENELTELDVSGLTALDWLACNHNPIEVLDLSSNSAIRLVYCGDGGVTNLTVLVDPSRTLGSNPGELNIRASSSTNPGSNPTVGITEKGVSVHGVTVIDKTM